MGLMDTLKKLNIIRTGSVSGVYKNAKDRPMALQDDMFMGKTEQAKTKKPKKLNQIMDKPSKTFLMVCTVLAVVFVLLALTTKIAWLFIVLWLVVLRYVWLLNKGKVLWIFGFTLTLFVVIISILSLLGILLTQSESNNNSDSANTTSTTKKLTTEECQPFYDKYNGKVLK
ncbi:MAG: hypothetical protein WAU88_06245, partial [Candidatus Zixiibacteriota bacterium]